MTFTEEYDLSEINGADLFNTIAQTGIERKAIPTSLFVAPLPEPWSSLMRQATVVGVEDGLTVNWFGSMFKVTEKEFMKPGYALVIYEEENV